MILRQLDKEIRNRLGDKKAIILLGARQTGKTTLLKAILSNRADVIWFNGDNSTDRLAFADVTVERLKKMIGRNRFVVIDEAQRISDIGIKMKLITDQIQSTQLIASGSSSFELANKINEPLTGRKWEYQIFPLSFSEMVAHSGLYQELKSLEDRLVFGYYPDVVTSEHDKMKTLFSLASDYLYKDILAWNKIKSSDKILKLLQALAYQLGNQVSYAELGRIVGLDNETVESYIDLLEKAFIVFRLPSFSRNLRTELKKSRKIYFYDNGIRNAVISNFNTLSMRNDTGALWENFLISERIKYTSYENIFSNKYFWRTTTQQEIDYIEQREGKLFAYEFKWSKKAKAKFPSSFLNHYPNAETQIVHQDNFEGFLGV
ncbi:MAG TPA: ATP-binding protein [Saprospiraceae bacterium]|nr:ATP-binding protein [Saprospiraceae bacterium]